MKLLLTALLTSVTLIGCSDYKEAKVFEDEYCELVAEGSWGNFKPEIDCGETE